MGQNYIVRADFYPNGSILPLGITGNNGDTIYIKRIMENKNNMKGETIFKCLTDKGECELIFRGKYWFVFFK